MPRKRPPTEAEKTSTRKSAAQRKPSPHAHAAKSPAKFARAKSGETDAAVTPKKARRSKPAPVSGAVPATIARSDRHAQSLWRKTLASAEKTYGDGARAHRVAYSALKHEYEKIGNRWVRKGEAGPSDAQAARGPTIRPRSTEKPARTERGHVVRKSGSPAELHAKSSGR